MAKAMRDRVRKRADDRCEYCQMSAELDVQPFQLDHARAQKHRGETKDENLVWSCLPCNSFKGSNVAGYDPDTESLERLFNPRDDTWADHFEWDGPKLVGLTAVGRTTIDVLRINMHDRVAHRRLLIESGMFP